MDANAYRGWRRRGWLFAAMLVACLAGASPALAQPFVYVADSASSSVSQYNAAGGPLTPLAPPLIAAGHGSGYLAISPDGKNLYAAGQDDDTVSQYSVGVNGQLTADTPATVPTGATPVSVAVSPGERSVYVTNRGDNTISQYNVGAGGALTPKTPATVINGPTGVVGAAFFIAISPDGTSVYVSNGQSSTVSQYDVGSGGALTPKTPATVLAGPSGVGFGAAGVAVSPDGKSVYVANALDGTGGEVFQFDVGSGGVLTPKTPAEVSTGGEAPIAIAVSPDGKSVYVTNAFGGGVSEYDVGAGGVLVPKTPLTVPAGTSPQGIAVSPDGKSVYVTNLDDATISQYNVDPSGGVLSPRTPATVAAGSGPQGIVVSTLTSMHPTSTSVSCSSITFAPGDATVCTATVTDTASSGQTTPRGTVSFENSGAGTFFGSPCTLSGSGASASCAVFFTSFARGGRIVAAGYGGDAAHSASSGITGVTVAVPASTAGCVVFGHGRITTAYGDKASFRVLVAAIPTRGVEFYRDNGPPNAMRVVSQSVDALTCSADATRASVFGKAKIDGAGSVEYRIDVQLTAWEGGKDSYRIRLGNGYHSGARQIRHGDVEIRTGFSEHHQHDASANHYKPGAGPDGG